MGVGPAWHWPPISLHASPLLHPLSQPPASFLLEYTRLSSPQGLGLAWLLRLAPLPTGPGWRESLCLYATTQPLICRVVLLTGVERGTSSRSVSFTLSIRSIVVLSTYLTHPLSPTTMPLGSGCPQMPSVRTEEWTGECSWLGEEWLVAGGQMLEEWSHT